MRLSGKKIILTVTNDLSGDQRVDRIASTLQKAGADVLVVGRELPFSKDLEDRPYHRLRLKLRNLRGKLFYLEYNWRLFHFLRRQGVDLICANDLDTLTGCWMASRWKGTRLIYDSHEYFTEVPELVGRPLSRSVWQLAERLFFPTLRQAYTVNEEIARIYSKKYRVPVVPIRNLPRRRKSVPQEEREPILIYQGALNLGRGIELMIEAMSRLPGYKLWIVGRGDIEKELRTLVTQMELEDRVVFKGFIPPSDLPALTRQARLGFSLEEDLGANYRLASPNKVYDYIQDGTPVLVSDLPVMARTINEYGVGEILDKTDRSPEGLAHRIRELGDHPSKWANYQAACLRAAEVLNWEREEERLLALYAQALDLTENLTFDSQKLSK